VLRDDLDICPLPPVTSNADGALFIVGIHLFFVHVFIMNEDSYRLLFTPVK